jgi:hypothetical protein
MHMRQPQPGGRRQRAHRAIRHIGQIQYDDRKSSGTHDEIECAKAATHSQITYGVLRCAPRQAGPAHPQQAIEIHAGVGGTPGIETIGHIHERHHTATRGHSGESGHHDTGSPRRCRTDNL